MWFTEDRTYVTKHVYYVFELHNGCNYKTRVIKIHMQQALTKSHDSSRSNILLYSSVGRILWNYSSYKNPYN